MAGVFVVVVVLTMLRNRKKQFQGARNFQSEDPGSSLDFTSV